MNWLSAGLTFLNISTIAALLLGLAAGGLSRWIALISFLLGALSAIAAYFGTFDPEVRRSATSASAPEPRLSKRAERRLQKSGSGAEWTSPITKWRYSSIWLWLVGAIFAMFALRSFCWLLYIDGNELKIQSPNNLGDLALHITYIKNFANGVALWPDNPIYVFSKLRYPAGVDLFNALLSLINIDLIRGLVWVGLLTSVATFYAFYRWGGAFGVAGFLFNGGLAGFQILHGENFLKFLDYQGDKTIAWKSIPLSMFVTQRGLLYSIPAGLLLLWHWRQKFYATDPLVDMAHAGSGVTDPGYKNRGPLPFWVELSLYATLPLFHVHTFLALSAVLFFLFIFSDAPMRWHTAKLVAAAFLPATFLVWLITDHFQAGSVMEWYPGWVLHSKDNNDFAMPFFKFWWVNFGIWLPLAVALVGWCGWKAWQQKGIMPFKKLPVDFAFLLPAAAIFIFGLWVKTAPWEWDNLKIMVWGYFLALPFLWSGLIAHWPLPLRVAACLALFGSGFVSLFGGLAAGRPGFGFANRGEVDSVGVFVRKTPVEARFAAYPIFNHPLLLQGRKVVLGYPGHLWTQGFDNYNEVNEELRRLMEGAGNWREMARKLKVRYIFWGREEKINYPTSTHPWESSINPLVSDKSWGALYDLESDQGPKR